MFYQVYRLRNFGLKLPPELIRQTCVMARLDYSPHPVYTMQMRASLFDPTTGIGITCLDNARRPIDDDRGVMVQGFEWQPSRASVWQAWWCVPVPDGQPVRATPDAYRRITSQA